MTTILVVDESLDLLDTASLMLDDAGYDVILTVEPQRAITLCEEIDFDLILCSLRFGSSNAEFKGVELLSALRSGQETPVVALTGSGNMLERELARKMGFLGSLRKPFYRKELLSEIEAVLNQNQGFTELRVGAKD